MGIFTLIQAREIGLSQPRVSKLVATKKLKRIAHGVYLHPEADIEGNPDFQIACAKVGPKAAIGGLTALLHYNLTEQVPHQVWVVVPPEKRSSLRRFKLIRTKTSLNHGIVTENGYRIVSLERAVLEGLKYVKKIGEHTAVKAARDALSKGLTNERKLGKAAVELGLQSTMSKYLQVITP